MITLLCICLIFAVFGKMLSVAVRMTWGLTKVIIGFVLFPVVIAALLMGGLVVVAVPFLLIAGLGLVVATV